MKCDQCGNESDFEAAFIRQRKSFRTSKRTLCVKCSMLRQHRFEGGYQLAVFIGGGVGYLLLLLNPYSWLGDFLSILFLINIFLILSIIPHELGHAFAARLFGWRVFQIIIGVGKKIGKFNLFGMLFQIHAIPVGGITRVAPTGTNWLRTKRFFLLLAGPAVNALIVAVVYVISSGRLFSDEISAGLRALNLFVMANAWIAIVNLVPFQSKLYNVGTDGKQMLKCLFGGKMETENLLATRYALEAEFRREENDMAGARQWCEEGLAKYPENPHLLNMQGILSLETADYARARGIFKHLLERETKPGLLGFVLMNNVAYTDALLDDPQLLPEADQLSKQAYGALSSHPAIVGTRGTVLLAMGNLPEAIKLLTESFENQTSVHGKADNACFLAIAHAQNGNVEQGKKFLDLAKQFQPDCKLIPKAERNYISSSLDLSFAGALTG